jgi:hypothetical protein
MPRANAIGIGVLAELPKTQLVWSDMTMITNTTSLQRMILQHMILQRMILQHMTEFS